MSPVISTIILTAVAITISVTTAFWMTNISLVYGGFEKVECVSAVSLYDEPTKMWFVSFTLRNTGTTQAVIVSALINDWVIPLNTVNPSPGNAGTDITEAGILVPRGNIAKVSIFIHSGGADQPFTNLITSPIILCKLISAEGKAYTKIVSLCPP